MAQSLLRQRYASRVFMVSSECRRVNTALSIFRQIAEHSPISPAPAANPHAVQCVPLVATAALRFPPLIVADRRVQLAAVVALNAMRFRFVKVFWLRV
jgi:hypothetical protein